MRLVVAAVVVVVAWLLGGPVSWAGVWPARDAGDVVVVDPYDQSRAVDHGRADTEFSVRLPDGAVCPGDSANDQWRVQSFIIPATDEPGAIEYGTIGPEPVGDGRYALFEVNTEPFVHRLTQRNASKGEPGVIPLFPSFDFAVVAGEEIPADTYRIGVACTFFGETAMYWDTEIVITKPAGESSQAITWRLASVPADAIRMDDESGSDPALVAGAVALAAVVAFGLYFRRRQGRSPITLAKDLR